jgi:hypothetical protein
MSLICLMMVAFPAPSSYALMLGLSTEDLARGSEVVIEGDVEDVESHWSEDGKTIYTSVTISIREAIKGRMAERKIVVEHEGGEIGDIGLKVSDMALFRKGERVILFLRSVKSRKAYSIVGKAQGKYDIDERGIARKRGFSLMGGEGEVDNDIPADLLKDKIKKTR